MKQILLLRHAKTEEAGGGMRDFDRRLTEAGQAAARAIGARARELGLKPDRVLCSPAARAMQTLDLFMQSLDPGHTLGRIDFKDDLYEQDEERLGELIAEVGDSDALLLVGHNPSMEALAHSLSGSRTTIKPGDLVVLTFEADGFQEARGRERLRSLCLYRP